MNFDALTKLSQMCKNYLDTGKGSERKVSENLLINLFEILGYHDELIVSPGAYNMDGEVSFQYALKKNNNENELAKVYIKVIDFGEDITTYEQEIHDTCLYQTHINDDRAYYVVTNCYLYKVYLNIPDGSNVVNLKELGNIQLSELDSEGVNLMKKLCLNEDENINNYEAEDRDNLSDEDSNTGQEKNTDKEKTQLNINKSLITKIGLIFVAIIFVLLIFKFLFEENIKNPEAIDNKPNSENHDLLEDEPNLKDSNFNSPNSSTVSYLNISAVLDLKVSSDEVLNIKMISNLEERAVVKLGIFSGDNSKYLYSKVNKDGTFETSFKIPETWGDPNVLVGAYLKFNEGENPQPSNVIEKYGKNGENIIWKEDYSKDMITFSEITHSNKLVEALLKELEEQKMKDLMNSIERDFSEIDTRVDAFGNIKHIPKGYSFDETNINESTNIYPMIFYDKKSDTSYLYVICGYVGTQFVRFEEVNFSADGYNWKYDNGTNERKNKISGNQKAEWVYFNNVNNSALINDMSLFANSKESKMILSGSLNKSYNISISEKNIIKQFLYIYETYYGNGTFSPNTEWFELEGTKVSLNYIVKPKEMRQRGYLEIESLKNYANSLSEKRLSNEKVSKEEEDLLDTMDITYREISPTIYNKIYNSIINSKSISIYNDDYETDEKYFKIYFFYDREDTIEKGYIPYINVYEDNSVIVPIKTITSSTDKYDKVFAKYYLNNSLYEELVQYFKSTNYKQFK